MGLLEIEGVTHWSIGVNNLEEAEAFYGDFLGLEARGRLGGTRISCFSVGENNILLCERDQPWEVPTAEDNEVHHSFTMSPKTLTQACKLFAEKQVVIEEPVYRGKGFFTERELYFFDSSGNRLELRDPTWQEGMPTPSFEEIVLL